MAEILNYSFSEHNFPACMSKEPSKGQYCASKLERKEEENRLKPQNFISGIVCRSKKHKNPVTGDSQLFSLHYCIPFFFSDVLELVAMQPGSKPHHLIILLLIAIEKMSFSVCLCHSTEFLLSRESATSNNELKKDIIIECI